MKNEKCCAKCSCNENGILKLPHCAFSDCPCHTLTQPESPDKEFIIGDDGEREWLCSHGIGHAKGVHTCDGCCSKPELPKENNKPMQTDVKPMQLEELLEEFDKEFGWLHGKEYEASQALEHYDYLYLKTFIRKAYEAGKAAIAEKGATYSTADAIAYQARKQAILEVISEVATQHGGLAKYLKEKFLKE